MEKAFVPQEYGMEVTRQRGGGSDFVIDFKVDFWNNLFEKKFPKYKDRLEPIFLHHSLEVVKHYF
jgi:hypothetical protein